MVILCICLISRVIKDFPHRGNTTGVSFRCVSCKEYDFSKKNFKTASPVKRGRSLNQDQVVLVYGGCSVVLFYGGVGRVRYVSRACSICHQLFAALQLVRDDRLKSPMTRVTEFG